MVNASSPNKKLILGTALWGWGVTRLDAFKILDRHLENGGIIVDTATNYPINKNPNDFGLAIRWLSEWASAHPNEKFSLIAKIGSINNMGGSEVDLSHKNIIETTNRLRDRFGECLSCVSIHWDDRFGEASQQHSIRQTVDAMTMIRESGLEIGLSGIKAPEQYYLSNPELANEWIIQVKENFLTHNARSEYEKHFPNARYFAYGINMGGVKLESSSGNSSVSLRGIKVTSALVQKMQEIIDSNHGIQPRPSNLNQLSLAFAHSNDSLSGVIIGPRNVLQLEETIQYWASLNKMDNKPNWPALVKPIPPAH